MGREFHHPDEWVASFIIREPKFQRFTLSDRFTVDQIPEAKERVKAAYLRAAYLRKLDEIRSSPTTKGAT